MQVCIISQHSVHIYCIPCTFPTSAFSAFEHNGSHTSQQSLLALNILSFPSAKPFSNFYFHFTFINTLYCPSASSLHLFGWVHYTESGVAWVSFVRLLQNKTLSPRCALNWNTYKPFYQNNTVVTQHEL